jgi:RNA polymerase sigma factor (TIGR02999 family)
MTDRNLFTALYTELRRLARREVRRHAAQDILGTDSLVHEAWLAIDRSRQHPFENEAQFLAYAMRTMRGLTIDRVRARCARKRGNGLPTVSLDEHHAEPAERSQWSEDIGEALDELAVHEPALARLIELKCSYGLTLIEIARAQGISERTAQRRWKKALDLLQQMLA